MIRTALLLAALAFPQLALAQDGQDAGRGPKPPWMDACGDDIIKLGCGDKHSREEVMACMNKHDSELSQKCKDFKAHSKKP